jgi:hypothetical protein
VNPLGWFALEEKERKGNWQRLGYAWPNSNLNLNSFKLGLNIILRWFLGVPNVIKSSWRKFEKNLVIRGKVLEKSLFSNKEAKEKRNKRKGNVIKQRSPC